MVADVAALVFGRLFQLSNGVAGWLLTYAVHSSAWLLLAWLLASRRAMRGRPALQHAVWVVATVAGVGTTTLQLTGAVVPVAGRLRVADGVRQRLAAIVVDEVGRDGRSSRVRFGTLLGGEWEGGAAGRHRTERALRHPIPPALTTANVVRTMVLAPPPAFFVVSAWGVVALVLAIRLAGARRVLQRALDGAADASATPAGLALRHLRRTAGVRREVALLRSDALRAPAAISTTTIALPGRLLAELTPGEQEGVIAHELAHVARRDTLWLRLALAIECLAWFQPLHYIARRRMQLAAEFAADAWAVRLTREPVGLARAIARIAEWVVGDDEAPRSVVAGAGVLGVDGSPLLQRVRRLTAAPIDAPRETLRLGSAASLVLAAVATLMLVALPVIDVGASSAPSASRRGTRDVRVVVLQAAPGRTTGPDRVIVMRDLSSR